MAKNGLYSVLLEIVCGFQSFFPGTGLGLPNDLLGTMRLDDEAERLSIKYQLPSKVS